MPRSCTAIKDAGAIVFGKTNVPLWSGDFQTFNEMFGTTNNPWDLTASAGRFVRRRGRGGRLRHDELRDRHRHRWLGARARRRSAACSATSRRSVSIPTLGYLDEPDGGVTESDVNVFGPIARSADDLEMLFGLLAGPTLRSRGRLASRSAAGRRRHVAFVARRHLVRRAVNADGL